MQVRILSYKQKLKRKLATNKCFPIFRQMEKCLEERFWVHFLHTHCKSLFYSRIVVGMAMCFSQWHCLPLKCAFLKWMYPQNPCWYVSWSQFWNNHPTYWDVHFLITSLFLSRSSLNSVLFCFYSKIIQIWYVYINFPFIYLWK